MDIAGGILPTPGARHAPSQLAWADAAAWEGGGLRREVFFFRSRGTELYGSLFAATEPSRPFGLVACGSWGVDADRSDPLVRSVALTMAKLGGAGLVFHYPGYGDSFGDLAEVDLDDLRDAACDAVAEAERRRPGLRWILAGFMFGASVACLARRRVDNEAPLLLVQPELRPGAYFRWLAQTSQPLAPGPSPKQMMEAGNAPGVAYGYPVPRRIVGLADEADEAVAAAVADFVGEGVVIRHAEPQPKGPLLERFRSVEVAGVWRFGAQSHPELTRAAAEWLDLRTRDGT